MPVAELRSIAGVTVGKDFVGSGEVRVFELPAMKVASVIHKGPYAELEKPYLYLYKDWLPKSGYDPGRTSRASSSISTIAGPCHRPNG